MIILLPILLAVILVWLGLKAAVKWLKDNEIWCKLGWHKWSMYAGYEQLRVHSNAICLRCGKKYSDGR